MSQPAGAVTVVIADDQTVVREGLRSLLGLLPGLTVVGVAATAEEALEQVARLDPDVLLTDLRMPGIGGAEGIRRLRASGSRTGAVALTTFDDDATIREALDAGALGFLNKDADPETIADAIRTAASGRSLLDARALVALMNRPASPTESPLDPASGTVDVGSAPRRAAPTASDGLTAREVDVLRLVAAGRSNQQIARELFVSLATVKTHVNHLLAKTQCTSRADLVRHAFQIGVAG